MKTARQGGSGKEKAKRKRRHPITRREFVGGALATAGVITAAPAFLRGQNLNSKLNLAFIAAGGRATANMRKLTVTEEPGGRDVASGSGAPHPDENVVVLCDVDQDALDAAALRYPKARKFNDLRSVFDRPQDCEDPLFLGAESLWTNSLELDNLSTTCSPA
jgi:hypothetical protein